MPISPARSDPYFLPFFRSVGGRRAAPNWPFQLVDVPRLVDAIENEHVNQGGIPAVVKAGRGIEFSVNLVQKREDANRGVIGHVEGRPVFTDVVGGGPRTNGRHGETISPRERPADKGGVPRSDLVVLERIIRRSQENSLVFSRYLN